MLLFAANSLLPAPLPSKLVESHSTLPPIRITSERKGPEAVVIDTSQLSFLPMLPDKEIAAAPSPPLSSDVADAVGQRPASLSEQADASDGNLAISPHVRETLAQLDPGVPMSQLKQESIRPRVEITRNFVRLGPRSGSDLLGIGVSIPHSHQQTPGQFNQRYWITSCRRNNC